MEYTTKEFANELNCSVRTLEDWRSKRSRKLLPARYDGRKAIYTSEQIPIARKLLCREGLSNNLFPDLDREETAADNVTSVVEIRENLQAVPDKCLEQATAEQAAPMGDAPANDLPQADDKQARIAEAEKFFNLIFGAVHETKFSYLWLKRDDTKKTVPFDVSTAERRRSMAQKAIEYSDSGFDVYFCTGLLDEPPKENERGTEDKITCRPVVVCDVDTLGGSHTNPKKYPAPSSVKDFLPFNLSVLVDSGYGAHGYCILAEPLAITEDNRAVVKARNAKFIETIRFKAGKFSKAVDSVGDLTRVLRVPGTRNYKLGVSNDAPICRLVEVNDCRFTPADLDAKLNALIDEHEKNLPAPKPTEETKKTARAQDNVAELGNDYDAFRIQKMLDVTPVKDLCGDEWFAVISALKNLGFTYEEVDRLNQGGEHYNEKENRARWDSQKDPSFDISTLHGIAKQFGYEERAARREWYNLHPAELNNRKALDVGKTAKIQFSRDYSKNTDELSFGVSDSISPKTNRQERADSMKVPNDHQTTAKLPPNELPTPDKADMGELMTTREVADILDVSKKTVENWRNRKLFGCCFFPADEKRGDTWYYRRERVEQLKAVYQFGILQNMYKLAKRNPEPAHSADFQKPSSSPRQNDFQKPSSSRGQNDWGEELSFRHREFFTVGEVADFFGVPVKTVEKWYERGQLKEDMLGHNGDLYFAVDNVLEFTPPKDQRKSNTPAPPDEPTDERYTKDFIADCPINLRIPQDFQFKKRGITFIKPATEKKPAAFINAALTPVVVTKILSSKENGTVRYEIAFRSRGKWERAEVDAQMLINPRKVFDSNKNILIEDTGLYARFFRHMLKDNEFKIPVITVYSKPGWHENKFVYPVPNSNEDYQVARAGIDYAEMFATQGDAEEWKTTFKLVTDFSSIHRIFFGAALASSLLKIIRVPNFWLHINGAKNSAKTLLMKLALSTYGDPNKLMRTFDSSPKNRVATAVALNDLPQAVDELESLDKKGQDELQKSIYDYFGGVDGQRNKRDGSVKKVEHFRGVRLSTGEQPLHKQNSKGGSFKRAIDLRISEPLFGTHDAQFLYQFCEYNHGHFGRQWTEYLSDNQATIKADFAALTNEIFDTCGRFFEPTHVNALCACAIAFWHFRRCISLAEDFQRELALADVRDVLKLVPTLTEISDLRRALAMLASWVDEHPREFMQIGEKTDSTLDAQSFAGRVGVKYADGRVGFFRNAFRQICEDKLGLPSYEKFLNEAFDAGKLEAANQRNKAKEKIIQGERKFLYMFKADVLIKVVDKERDLEAEKLANEYGF